MYVFSFNFPHRTDCGIVFWNEINISQSFHQPWFLTQEAVVQATLLVLGTFGKRLIIQTRGPKGHISCTWVQCATFLRNRPGQPFLFTDWPEKYKLGRGHWDLASCQVWLNSIQQFQRRSRKRFRGQCGHLVFPIGSKNTNKVEDAESLLPVKFRWMPLSSFRGEVDKSCQKTTTHAGQQP